MSNAVIDFKVQAIINPMQHHAFVIEAEAEEGIATAQMWAEKELGMKVGNNPDVIVLHYGLLSVDDARRVTELAAGRAFAGDTKVVIIAASRAYHEAQNALLKLFEEPPAGTCLFFILPSLGGLLPTLRSRVQVLERIENGKQKIEISEAAEEFMKATKEKRSAFIKKLTSGKDEEERRENREEALAIMNGIEVAAYAKLARGDGVAALLSDIAVLRGHLHDRSAPVRMILEHLSLVIPKGLV
jgi:DNA polymerase III delta prime subunit